MQFQQNTQYTNYDSKYYCRVISRGGGGGWVFLVGFWIGMLSTVGWLVMLQGAQKGGRHYTFHQNLTKNRGQNMTFSSFLLKYMGRKYTNFPVAWKRGVEMTEHM